MKKNIIGFDLSDEYCQISFYNDRQQEPQTLEPAAGRYQIRTDSVESVLERLGKVAEIVFTVPQLDMDLWKKLKEAARKCGIPEQCIHIQEYKESFCNYMFHQPRELWNYEVALFHCERGEMKVYILRKLRNNVGKGKETFVTVEEVAREPMPELVNASGTLHEEMEQKADEHFVKFVQEVFQKRLISSVYLTGEGFQSNWYKKSLKVLCNGRRAFLGNNLYSKGAGYAAYRKYENRREELVYLDDTTLMEQISFQLRVNGKEEWYPVIAWGTRWYEANQQFEVLLSDDEDLEIRIESLRGKPMRTVHVPLKGLPKRKDYALRLQVNASFLDENTCKISFRDVGFGEFFQATDFYVETVIQLGGI